MTNTIKRGMLALVSLFLLTGCQKPPEPQAATESLVKAIMYQEEVAAASELFVLEEAKGIEGAAPDVISEIETMLPLDEAAKASLAQLVAANEAQFREETSFTTTVLAHEKGRAEVEVSVVGLEALDETVMMAQLEDVLGQGLSELTAETPTADVEALISQVSYDMLVSAFAIERKVKAAETVNVSLMVDAREKTKWVIQNEDTFVTELLAAFGQ